MNATTRRSALMGAGALALIPRPPAAAPSPEAEHPDAALLGLCAAFHAVHAEWGAMEAPDNDPAFEAASDRWWVCLRAAIAERATTPAGIRAKAGLLLPTLSFTIADPPFLEIEHVLAESLVRDILAVPA